jgi:hypothetical protein
MNEIIIFKVMMKRSVLTCSILLLLVTFAVAQQPDVVRASPMASINMRYKDAYARIVYSRPLKNGREIFGKLIPYAQVWRTGANEATELTITRDMLINGKQLKAGTYSLFTIPDKDKWTIIVNSEVGLWGAYNYNEKLDVMRFDVVANHENVIYEPFTMEFVQKNELADLLMYWDNVKVSIPLKFLN